MPIIVTKTDNTVEALYTFLKLKYNSFSHFRSLANGLHCWGNLYEHSYFSPDYFLFVFARTHNEIAKSAIKLNAEDFCTNNVESPPGSIRIEITIRK